MSVITPQVETLAELNPGVYSCARPSFDVRIPLLFEMPQSGTDYPNDFRSCAPFDQLHFLISPYVDALLRNVGQHGATALKALFPMTYINANRTEADLDLAILEGPWPVPVEPTAKVKIGIGLIQRWARPGVEIYDRKLSYTEVQGRIEQFYRPYHQKIADILAGFKTDFGGAWHIDCHCMGTVGSVMSPDSGQTRADFCIGDRDGTTTRQDFVQALEAILRGFGYSVSINAPFKGVEIVRRHGAPSNNIHSLQLEIRRGLFVDEKTNERSQNFDRMVTDLTAVAEGLAKFVRGQIGK